MRPQEVSCHLVCRAVYRFLERSFFNVTPFLLSLFPFPISFFTILKGSFPLKMFN